MSDRYGICRRTWKWTKKLFFHFLDLSILNAFLLHKSCGGRLNHKHFRTQLIRKLVQNVDMTTTRLHRGRSSLSARRLSRLEEQKFNHWPVNGTKRRCVVCSLREKQSTSSCICRGAASHLVYLCVSWSVTRKQTFRRVWNINE
jgi:hypothetical protein